MNDAALHLTPSHLTEDQLDDHLIGDLAAPAAAHLAACALCTARVAEATSPLASFQAVSLAWSERVSATAPMPELRSSHAFMERRLVWSMAIAACAVGLGISSVSHRLATPAPSATVASRPVAPTPDQISSDNQLLRTIDRELDATAESPAALGLVPVGAARNRTANAAYQD
jgi:hypothetical protein